MTLAVRNSHAAAIALPDDSDSAMKQLILWAEAAGAAEQLAERLCNTRFAPAAYRNKPIEGAAAIMAGAEVGLSPIASLRAFDDIQGTPAPKAITLRAIVQSRGHDILITKSTDTEAVVTGRRKGDTEWQTCTWTIDRATKAGYPKKNGNWNTNPAAMLVARATSEVCRWVASDAIMGMPYSAEEIQDQGLQVDARPAPRRVAAAEILGEAEPSAPQIEERPRVRDDVLRRHMFALWNDLGFGGEENRDQRLVIIGKILNLPGPVSSSNDLDDEQMHQVVQALQAKKRHLEQQQAAVAETAEQGDEEPVGGDES